MEKMYKTCFLDIQNGRGQTKVGVAPLKNLPPASRRPPPTPTMLTTILITSYFLPTHKLYIIILMLPIYYNY